MHRLKLLALIFLAILLLLPACTKAKNISNEEVKAFKKELLAVDHVRKVAVTLWPPGDVIIEVTVTDEIGQEEIDQVLELTKEFVTVSNMRKIARQFKRSSEVGEVYLEFRDKKAMLLKRYVSRFFKTYQRIYSPEHLEEYKIWRDETPKRD